MLVALALILFGASAGGEAETLKARARHAPTDDCENAPARVFVAADAGDADEVRRLLKCGVDPNGKVKMTPPLVVAARAGHAEVARTLLDAGASVEGRSPGPYTALFFAARGGHAELVGLLLERGADVNAPGYDGHTVLMRTMHGATHAQLPPPLREVLRRTDDEDDPAHPKTFGSRDDYRRVLHVLVAAGADLNAVADCGETALAIAPLTHDIELVKILLAAGARVDYGWPPLCLAGLPELFMETLVDDETLGRIDDERLQEEAERAAAEWPARTAAARREIIALLEAAGATRHNCDGDVIKEGEGEEDDGGKENDGK